MKNSVQERAEAYWADRLACPRQLLRTAGLHFIDALQPEQVFVVSVGSSTLVAAAPVSRDPLAGLDPPQLCEPSTLARVLPPAAIFVGPAFVGYSLIFSEPGADLIAYSAASDPAFAELRASLPAEAWRHANLDAAAPPVYAAVRHGYVVAASGAQLLGGHVAHIGVATHPEHRGQGLARAVVSAVGFAAGAAGLLPQYQTLHSNTSAMAVGRALGFERFATTLSARWGSAIA